MLRALRTQVSPADVSAVVNVGDDLVLHGLTICPDLDTISYTLTGRNNEELGWGLNGETWRVMEQLGQLGGANWFGLGDLDLATHLYRSQRLAEGATKTQVTTELAERLGVDIHLWPVTNDPVATTFESELGTLTFQEYFVRHHHNVSVSAVHFTGASSATLTPEARRALEDAERIIIAPSNPLISIGPLVAIPGVRDLLERRRADVIAVSPIIAGAAVKGPADRLLRELGYDVSCVGVATYYEGLIGTMVIDEADRDLAERVAATGCRVVVTTTLMSDPLQAQALVRAVLS